MTTHDFTTIVDAEPEQVKDHLWKVHCTFTDGSWAFYPTSYGTKHAALRAAASLLETAEEARAHG